MKSQTIGPCSFGPQLNNFGLAMIQRKKFVENFLWLEIKFSRLYKNNYSLNYTCRDLVSIHQKCERQMKLELQSEAQNKIFPLGMIQ